MALSIISVVRISGPQCDHISMTVDDEGTERTFATSFAEVDELIGGQPLRAKRDLVLLWAAYRRAMGRAVVGMDIG